jgi:hypothetical protein
MDFSGITNIAQAPEPFYSICIIIARYWSALLGIGCILLTYFLIKKLTKRIDLAAIFSGLLIFNAMMINMTHFAMDIMASVFFGLLTVYFAYDLMHKGRMKDYFLTGVALGLTAASKYSAAAIVIFVIACYIIRVIKSYQPGLRTPYFGKFNFDFSKIFFCAIISLAVFLIVNPSIVTEPKVFIDSITPYLSYSEKGDGDRYLNFPLPFYFNAMMNLMGIFLFIFMILILFKGFTGFVMRNFKDINALPIVIFLLIYLLKIGTLHILQERYVLMMFPLMYILMAQIMANDKKIKLIYENLIVVIAICFLFAIFTILQYPNDGRITSEKWIEENIPGDSSILTFGPERFNPYINETKYNYTNIRWYNNETSVIEALIYNKTPAYIIISSIYYNDYNERERKWYDFFINHNSTIGRNKVYDTLFNQSYYRIIREDKFEEYLLTARLEHINPKIVILERI